MRRLILVAVGLLLLLTGCGGTSAPSARTALTIVVNAPFSRSPYLGRTIENGARLAAGEVNANGIRINGRTYDLRVTTMDTALSPARAVANMRRAVGQHAVAVVDEGTGIDAAWRIANGDGMPVGVVFEGGRQIIDPVTRPDVFRIAPSDHGIAFRLAEYLVPKGLKLALLHDDSDYGAAGERALTSAFSQNRSAVAIDETLPADALDFGPQVLRARRAHATGLLVWGRPATIAAVLTAARSAGWNVPVFTPPAGSDPFVRQQLADHPRWVDGLTFAGGRLTAEIGTAPFLTFQQKYESAFGVDRVGVTTSAGHPVIVPPESAMYAYDFVNLIAAALLRAASTGPAKVTTALNEVTTEGANGDQRAFNRHNHEGVVDDDIYFARFHDMIYAPVKDDPLSATLPTLPQTR
ncbi:MAG: amino acid transporter substrate-binding protein [Actinomycetia bacterium]|nr:amino acid transporter substrate-binding protein [Actinomycetes bacterium]